MTKIAYFCKLGCLLIVGVFVNQSAWGESFIYIGRSPLKWDVSVDLSYWQTEGDFKMSGQFPSPSNSWEIVHPLDSSLLISRFRLRMGDYPSPYFVGLSIGQGMIDTGNTRDTDWNSSKQMTDLVYSTSQGRTAFSGYSLNYQFVNMDDGTLDAVIKFTDHKIVAEYSDASVVMSSGLPDNRTFPGKWLSYEMDYSGIEFGLEGTFMPAFNIGIEGSFGYAPFVTGEYSGQRWPFSSPPVPALKESIISRGYSFNYELSLQFKPVSYFGVQGGFRYLKYHTVGEDQEGTSWAGSREHLDADFKGMTLNAVMSF
ncbi:MAG: hypothetical protein WC980_07610 [Candidatus Brocadiia bacterium]